MTKKLTPVLWLSILSLIVTVIATTLSFICIFAGHKPGYLEDYALLTLNTSRIGDNILLKIDQKIEAVGPHGASILNKRHNSIPTIEPTRVVSLTTTEGPFTKSIERRDPNIFDSISAELNSEVHTIATEAKSIGHSIATAAASEISSVALSTETDIIKFVNNAFEGVVRDFGLNDFYSLHVMDTCTGNYVYNNGTVIQAGSMATLDGTTHKEVISCTNHSVVDPMFLPQALYVIGTVLCFATFFLLPFLFMQTRPILLLLNTLVAIFAFVSVALASLGAHGIAMGAAEFLNGIGEKVGITCDVGKAFSVLTGSTTVMLFINVGISIAMLFVQREW